MEKDMNDSINEVISDKAKFSNAGIDGQLKFGEKYTSFDQLQKAVSIYCDKNNVRLFKSDSRKLKSAQNRVNQQIRERTPAHLVYYSLTYSCVYNGKSFKNLIKDLGKSSNEGCKFIIKIGLSSDYQLLEVVKISDPKIHNHSFADKMKTSTGNREEKIHDVDEAWYGKVAHMDKVTSTLSEYRKSGLFCDTAIVAQDGMLYAHSAILAIFCPSLYSSLNQKPFHNHQPNMIDLAKYPSVVIQSLLDFFYDGKMNITCLSEVQELARYLKISFDAADFKAKENIGDSRDKDYDSEETSSCDESEKISNVIKTNVYTEPVLSALNSTTDRSTESLKTGKRRKLTL